MSKTVQLHGGPWHGKQIALPSDQDHFHIVGPAYPLREIISAAEEEGDLLSSQEIKEGIYSQVAGPGHTHDFEWDGWVSHDHQ